VTITIEFDDASITLNVDSSLRLRSASMFDLAEEMQVQVPTSCKKNGKCRECLIEVKEGIDLLTPRVAQESHLRDEFRLSCRTRIDPDAWSRDERRRIRCHTLKREAMRIDEKGQDLPLSFRDVPLAPAVTREGQRILLDGRIIAEGTSRDSGIYGVALDIGTTTVVARLINLETGHALAARAFENPQRFAGSNVMSRIQFDLDNKGRLLQRTLLGYLARALESFPVDPLEIYEVVVVANPTMRDLFFGLNVATIGRKPFQSITELEQARGLRETSAIETTARKLRLPIHPEARVLSLPLPGCHVGADAAACLLTCDIENRTKPFMLMDIGTNTEIICGTREKLFVASCPAGPAFEGGSIDCGMPGLSGAIERISLAAGGAPSLTVIGDGRAEGICGSGLVDLLNGLLRTNQMDSNGRLCDGRDRIYVCLDPPIYLSESDISELAQAKGASQAGARILLKHLGLTAADLDRLYLAGGFARHLDITAAKKIGLIPDLPEDRVSQIGNAALEGASIALVSLPHRSLLSAIVARAAHVSLEKDPDFFDLYVDGCIF
jgi:uncharacterized 2Fe-2S/4Fe-4S cluster protein (DUF4445 family)